MSTDPVATYVALLRGINVGGKNKLLMRDLTAMFTLAGCEAAETYIQSGNVVFKAGAALASAATAIRSSISYNTVSKAKAIVGGQGSSSSSPKRTTLELSAMNHAKEYYSSQGWQWDDVSAYRPYDLSCTKPTGASYMWK